MEDNIPVLLCKLEQIFSSSFFDSMEHLLIHLPYEARVNGPIQYCWMYPFEKYKTSNHLYIIALYLSSIFLTMLLHSLKNKVKNKVRVEASIFEAYLVEETSTFASFYYPNKIETRRTKMPRNVDASEGSSSTSPISIFNYPKRAGDKSITYFLDQVDHEVTHLYILLNYEKVEPYLE
ncbi:hypothetical protein CR513_50833, partial [Mucuna pruriens]